MSTPLLFFILKTVKMFIRGKEVSILNQIKKARQLRKIPQNELAKKLDITQQAISRYENSSRTPDEKTWEKIALILQVPVEFLKGETDDPDGWDLWEKNTGYSIQEIKNEIKRIKNANHVIGDEHDLQNLIGQAVANLSGIGNTDRGILDKIARDIHSLQAELINKYEDPKKIEKLPGFEKNGNIKIRSAATKPVDFIFDDLNPDAYERALDILIQARRDLQNISNDFRLK